MKITVRKTIEFNSQRVTKEATTEIDDKRAEIIEREMPGFFAGLARDLFDGLFQGKKIGKSLAQQIEAQRP